MKRNTNQRPRSSRVRGFTLLEVLVSVTLVTLSAGVVATSLVSGSNGDGRAVLEELQSLDRRARLLSRRLGPLSLSTSTSGQEVVLRRTNGGARIAASQIPTNGRCDLRSASHHPTVVFDSLGRCPDYQVTIRTDQVLQHWIVSGSTGWWQSKP